MSELRFSCLQNKYSLSHLFRPSFLSLGPDFSLACDTLYRASYVYLEVNGHKVKRRGEPGWLLLNIHGSKIN